MIMFRNGKSGSRTGALKLWVVGAFSLVAMVGAAAAWGEVTGAADAVATLASPQKLRQLTMEEAREAAVAASRSGAHLPLNMNELVLAELNRYLGTPKGRAQLREALGRLPQYRALITGKLEQYGLPPELVAVPVHESGYQNVAWQPGAGLWGFIKETARHYDLVVSVEVDERLDEARETDAAMRYLRDLNNIFHDWRLALKAYNEGESHVMKLIKKFETRDAWELEHKAESREHYLASITAIAIVMNDPALLD